MPGQITSPQDFESMMRTIDAALQQEGVPIHMRELEALRRAAMMLNTDLKIQSPAAIPGLYEGDSLSGHIVEWVRARYADRLKIDTALGYSAIVLKADAWLFKFPLAYGEFRATVDRDLSRHRPRFVVSQKGQPREQLVFNVLLCIDKLPQGLASELSDDELRAILQFFLVGQEFFNALKSFCRDDDLAMAALLDFNTAARHCVAGFKEYGLSRWASLQAAEKMLKHYISKRGGVAPFSHKLDKLTSQASELGLATMDQEDLRAVQCDAAVRYQVSGQTLDHVVTANHNAMGIGLMVLRALYPMADTSQT